MTIGEAVAIISVVCSAIWAVASWRKDMALLRNSVDNLSKEMRAFRTELHHHSERSDDHEGRLIRLETLREGGGPGDRAPASA